MLHDAVDFAHDEESTLWVTGIAGAKVLSYQSVKGPFFIFPLVILNKQPRDSCVDRKATPGLPEDVNHVDNWLTNCSCIPQEAAEIGQRRAAKPPPPFPAYARASIESSVESGALQDLIYNSLESALDKGGDGGTKVANANQGWDW